MKKALLILMCMIAMMMSCLSIKAQEVTIILNPGWTWISIPNVDTLDFATVLGTFTPAAGDMIKSQTGNATYLNGQWRGSVSQFYPGHGYKYKSNRTEPVTLTLCVQQLVSQVVVTTSAPTDITAASAVVGGTVTLDEGNHVYACGVCWDTVQMPTVDNHHTTDNTGTSVFSITLTGLTPCSTYYVRAYVVTDYGLVYSDEQSFTTLDGSNSGNHGYVDLGLPSGTLWATCNVGANFPEEYGDYFAWGETQPKDTYNWINYQYYYIDGLIKYCTNSNYGYNGFTDNLVTLQPEDDAATANWGIDWCMPTYEAWLELINNTIHIWTTLNSVNGWLFTASNGNSLFFPAAGYRDGNNLYNVGSYGGYWSSSLGSYDTNCAWSIIFYTGHYQMGNSLRNCGRSVRPVRSGLQN